MNRDDILMRNEEEIIRIKYEIDISRLEMEQRKELVVDLEMQLERDKGLYKEGKHELKKLEKRAEQLQRLLKQKDDEMEQLEEILRDRDHVIEDLEKQIGEKAQEPELPKVVQVLKKKWYIPIKGDLVDELMAKYLNEMNCPLPVKRIGDGNYLFGTKKIFARIMQGKLVIRVGGGFMSIDEFINTYAEFEVQKVQQLIEQGKFNLDEYSNSDMVVFELSPKSNYQDM